MKKLQLLALGLLLAACSSPKYTYYFDHYQYQRNTQSLTTQPAPAVTSPLTVAPESITADLTPTPAVVTETPEPVALEEAKAKVATAYKSLSKEEKKEFRRELKKEIKQMKAMKDDGTHATQQLEGDVKWAAIFGSIGLVLLIIGGDLLYVLGAIALLVGLYFFIRWLSRQ